MSLDPELVAIWHEACEGLNTAQKKIEARTGKPFPIGKAMMTEVLANAHEEGVSKEDAIGWVRGVADQVWRKLDAEGGHGAS